MRDHEFFCKRWADRVAAAKKPITGRYRDMLKVQHYGDELVDRRHTNWAITASFDLLVFHSRHQHNIAFGLFGFKEEDMLLTGCGHSIRAGHIHPFFEEDPKGEWELTCEVKRVLRNPAVLDKP